MSVEEREIEGVRICFGHCEKCKEIKLVVKLYHPHTNRFEMCLSCLDLIVKECL